MQPIAYSVPTCTSTLTRHRLPGPHTSLPYNIVNMEMGMGDEAPVMLNWYSLSGKESYLATVACLVYKAKHSSVCMHIHMYMDNSYQETTHMDVHFI